jgi:hypothetical protein
MESFRMGQEIWSSEVKQLWGLQGTGNIIYPMVQ